MHEAMYIGMCVAMEWRVYHVPAVWVNIGDVAVFLGHFGFSVMVF